MYNPVVLGPHRLYMLPTRQGLLFALVLLALLLASVNYNNGLGFLLTFLLASLGVVSMLYTHRNLTHLHISPGYCAPVFAGEAATFEVCLHNPTDLTRLAIQLEAGKQTQRVSIGAGETVRVQVTAASSRRGYLDAPSLVVASRFPLGLLRSWSRRIELPQRCLVYPAPQGSPPVFLSASGRLNRESSQGPEGDDFVGLRAFQPGESPHRISWKTLARGQGLYTKQFGGDAAESLWLDWDALSPLDTELRLSRLSRGVVEAEQAGRLYGLRVPGTTLSPDQGEAHYHRCLKTLALFPGTEAHG